MLLKFGVLGPLQVSNHTGVVPIRSVPQRRLLAMLLARDGEPVRLAELVDGLWPAAPPKNAEGNVRSYVSRLNDALPGPDRISHGPAGYSITLRPGELDAREFTHLAEQARAAREAGNAEHAADSLGRALALWRGSPYAGLEDCPFLVPVIEGLRQLRLEALEDHAEVSLRLGRHANLVPELTARLAEHPDRERLAGLLMRAQYGSGQQTAALETYRRTRDFLVEEHGVEPGPELRALQEAILRRDPGIEARPEPTVPMQLPTGVYGFAGRVPELAQLDALLDAAGHESTAVVISAIAGTAGVGKTALAVHWARRVRDHFPDGQLYVNLRGFDQAGQVLDPAEAIRGLLDALGVPAERRPVDLDAQAALYRSLLDGKRVLVVLDNARDSEQVRPLLPGSAGCLAIVTSRNQLTGLVAAEGAQPLNLGLLPSAEARELLTRRLGPGRVAAEPHAVEEIIDSCARLPLALAIAAARAATHPHFPLHLLAAELRDARGLAAFTGAEPTTDARAVFSWSYRQLSAEAQRLFRLLGLHPGPDTSAAAAASLAGLPAADLLPLLAELTRAHLLSEHTPGRYTFHDLLRAYAAELAHTCDTEDDRHTATNRLLDHYLHSAYAATRLLAPQRDPLTLGPPRPGVTPEQPAGHGPAMEWFTAEDPVLLIALAHAAAAGFDAHAWQLAWALETFLYRKGRWHDQAAALQIALGAAQRLGDGTAQSRAHRNLANVYSGLGHDNEEAREHLKLALELDIALGDRVGQAHTYSILAHLEGANREDALTHAQRALALYQAAGHRGGQARALNAIGWIHAELGDYERSLACCEQAIARFRELEDRDSEAATWDSLGYAHHHLRQYERAAACYHRALDLYRELGSAAHEAIVLDHLGDTQHAIGDLDAARRAFQQALTILKGLDHPDTADVRGKLERLGVRS